MNLYNNGIRVFIVPASRENRCIDFCKKFFKFTTSSIFYYLTVSAEPLSPPTVEHLTAIGVLLPILENTLALQYLVIS